MNKTLDLILDSRYDLSDYLFHFTSGSNAKNTLNKILTDKKLLDVRSKGIICFTEAPLPSLVQMFNIFAKYDKPMYAPYGIAIPKIELFDLGARPVISGPEDEIYMIDEKIRWRYEQYDPRENDFSWLREWRLNKTELDLDNTKHFVITKETSEELDYSFEEGEIEVDGDVADGQFWPFYYMNYSRNWKSISIENIMKLGIKTRSEITEQIIDQQIGDEISVFLGSGGS